MTHGQVQEVQVELVVVEMVVQMQMEVPPVEMVQMDLEVEGAPVPPIVVPVEMVDLVVMELS